MVSSPKVDKRITCFEISPCQAVQDMQLLLAEAGSDGGLCMVREENKQAESMELRIGRFGDVAL